MGAFKTSLSLWAFSLCLVSGAACGEADKEKHSAASRDLLPLAEGNTWTYRVTDGDEVTMKTVSVGAEEAVGGDGPNKAERAFKTKSERDGEITLSWQAQVDGKVIRYRDQTTDKKSGEVSIDEYWDPYRVHVDGTEEHLVEGASWLEEFEETATKQGETKDSETVRERWTVLSESDEVTVPAGTFDAIVLQKAGGTKLKTYWYVPGVGKVKESGGQVEELSDYQIED